LRSSERGFDTRQGGVGDEGYLTEKSCGLLTSEAESNLGTDNIEPHARLIRLGGTVNISKSIAVQVAASVLLSAGSTQACEMWVQIGPKKICQQRVIDTTFLLEKKDALILQRLMEKSKQNQQKLDVMPPSNALSPNAK